MDPTIDAAHDNDDYSEKGLAKDSMNDRRDAPSGKTTCGIYLSILFVVFIVESILVWNAPGLKTCVHAVPFAVFENSTQNSTANEKLRPATLSGYNTAMLLGNMANNAQVAACMALVAFVSGSLCALTSAYDVSFRADLVERDFEHKGTLSNTVQDISTPRGRMFTVMLFMGALMLMFSMYTLYIYPNWMPMFSSVDDHVIFLFGSGFQSYSERGWKIAWAIFPNLALMYTALLPSLSNTEGTNMAMVLVHNITAPLGVGFGVIMQTFQLSWGENAFAYFFCSENASWLGPLSIIQRIRVMVVCNCWVAVVVFLSLQVYFGIGDVFGIKIKTNYRLALVSFFSEITVLFCVFGLPAIQGLGFFLLPSATPMHDAAFLEKSHF